MHACVTLSRAPCLESHCSRARLCHVISGSVCTVTSSPIVRGRLYHRVSAGRLAGKAGSENLYKDGFPPLFPCLRVLSVFPLFPSSLQSHVSHPFTFSHLFSSITFYSSLLSLLFTIGNLSFFLVASSSSFDLHTLPSFRVFCLR